LARAKRTDRAAARRRYRATSALDPADEAEDSADPSPSRSAGSTQQVATGVRLGLMAGLRQSFHPLNLREDIAALPSLVRDKALLIPLGITLLSTFAVLATGGRDTITAILFAYFVQTPAIGGVFLAGFLAPRASWLLGVIIGVVSAIGYVAILVLIPNALTTNQPSAGTIQSVATSALLLSPIVGGLFAAAAAWYRRFLTLTNPNRGRRAQAAKRAGDGKTRATTQKAGARR
jgi:hypothetical protein